MQSLFVLCVVLLLIRWCNNGADGAADASKSQPTDRLKYYYLQKASKWISAHSLSNLINWMRKILCIWARRTVHDSHMPILCHLNTIICVSLSQLDQNYSNCLQIDDYNEAGDDDNDGDGDGNGNGNRITLQ